MAPSRRRTARSAARPTRRPRAPRRVGARTTLRVPDDLAEAVARYAEEHRTSMNDALIRLAYDGAHRYDYEYTVEELAAERGAAINRLIDREIPPDAGDLTDEETTRAILGFRLGLYDEEIYGA
ncbi:MAG TPA: hypothetical protein VN635_14995 [Conexibacter sp.]|nr:hypothetical protein [Conexibacter sp.]